MTLTLTVLEKQALELAVEVQNYFTNNGEEGFSDLDLDEITAALKINTKSARGVVGSLIKKGLFTTQDVNGEYNIYYATNEGFKAIKE